VSWGIVRKAAGNGGVIEGVVDDEIDGVVRGGGSADVARLAWGSAEHQVAASPARETTTAGTVGVATGTGVALLSIALNCDWGDASGVTCRALIARGETVGVPCPLIALNCEGGDANGVPWLLIPLNCGLRGGTGVPFPLIGLQCSCGDATGVP